MPLAPLPLPGPSAPPAADRPRQAAFLALWAALLAAAFLLRGVLLPFLGGAALAYLLAPAIARLQSVRISGRRLPRWAAILVLYVFGAALLFTAVSLALPHLVREAARLSARAQDLAAGLTPERVSRAGEAATAWLAAHGLPFGPGGGGRFGIDLAATLRAAGASLGDLLRAHLAELLGLGPRLVAGVVSSIFGALLVVVIAALVLSDPGRIAHAFEGLFPAAWRPGLRALGGRIDDGLAGGVRGQLIICLVNGVLTFAGLLLFRVPFAYGLALLAALLAFIPIFGTFVSSVPIVIAGLSQGFHVGFALFLWILGVHAIEAYVLNPKVMGGASHIHPLLILLALLAGEHDFGILGALFAVPAVAVLLAASSQLREWLEARPPAAGRSGGA